MDLDGRKVLVVGLARTGLATIKFLRAKGSIVSTTEMKPKEEMKILKAAMNGIALDAPLLSDGEVGYRWSELEATE